MRDYTKDDFNSNSGRIRHTSTRTETEKINPLTKRIFFVNSGDFQNRKNIKSDGWLYF